MQIRILTESSDLFCWPSYGIVAYLGCFLRLSWPILAVDIKESGWVKPFRSMLRLVSVALRVPSSCYLRALYIAEKCYPTDGSSWILPFSDFFDYINDFWATRRSQEAKKISTDSWDDVLHDQIIYVSRSGKFTAFYIAYINHMADKSSTAHTIKNDVSRIQVGIHENTPY